MKQCPKCSITGDEHFNKDKTRSGGFSRLCKTCIAQYRRENGLNQKYYQKDREKNIERSIRNRKKRRALQPNKPTGFRKVGRPKQSLMKTYYRKISHGARDRGLVMEVDDAFLNDLLIKQNYLCSYTKMKISLEDRTASLDRIDSNIGYTSTNVHWVDKRINFMKQSMSHEEFVVMCVLVAQNITCGTLELKHRGFEPLSYG